MVASTFAQVPLQEHAGAEIDLAVEEGLSERGGAPRGRIAAAVKVTTVVALAGCLAAFALFRLRFAPSAPAAVGAAERLAGLAEQKLIDVPEALKDYPGLCDADIVKETCALMSDSTPEFYGTKADTNASILHAAELSYALMVDRDCIIDWLKKIGTTNAETNKSALDEGAYAVTCKQLCEKTVASYGDDMLPAVSDVACYNDPTTEEKVCDLDVSPDALGKINNRREVVKVNATENREKFNITTETDTLKDLDKILLPKKDDRQLALLAAMMFRIHPLLGITVHRAEKRRSLVNPKARRLFGKNDDSCKYAKDGECDNTNGWCTHGTDCTDCGDCPGNPNANNDQCKWAKDGECDGEEFCTPGTDCTDCKNCDGGAVDPDTIDNGNGHTGSEIMVKSVQETATAVAWAANAARKIGAGQQTANLKTWFGNNFLNTRNIAKSVANSAILVMNNCEIRENEHECNKKPGTLAYVYPGQKNSQGQYIIFMCVASLNYSPLAGVLYHEASHHPTSRTDDVIYGRGPCKGLAKSNPNGALNNADSHEYFVTDVNQR